MDAKPIGLARVNRYIGFSTILIGEGIYGLVDIGDSTSPSYWTLSITGGAGLLVYVGLLRQKSPVPIIFNAVTAMFGSFVFYLVYSGG